MAHLHEVRDADSHFVIDPITREITNGNAKKNKLMQGDHNSEIFTFEIPKMIEGHDMALCNRVEIHFNNISAAKENQSKDFYTVKDMKPDDDEVGTLVFSWPISGNATKYAGLLSFRIRFGCVEEDGVWTYKWHTDIFSGITISAGFDNTEAIIKEYADAIAAWEAEQQEMDERVDVLEQQLQEDVIEERIATAVADYLKENPIDTGSKLTIGFIELLADKWVGDTSPYSQVVEVPGATEFSQVDLTPSVEQLAIFHDKDLAFVTENEDGVVTVYAIGDKPLNDYTMQVTIKEVSV